MTLAKGRQLQRAYSQWFVERKFTHAVTLKPNYLTERATPDFLRQAFIRFHQRVDRVLLGPRYNHISKASLRTEAFGVMEGIPNAGHLHAAFKIPEHRWEDFEALFRPLNDNPRVNPHKVNVWAAQIVGGSSVVERITDPAGWYNYSLKMCWDENSSDRMIFLPL